MLFTEIIKNKDFHIPLETFRTGIYPERLRRNACAITAYQQCEIFKRLYRQLSHVITSRSPQ